MAARFLPVAAPAGGRVLLSFLPFVHGDRVAARGARELWILAYLVVPTTLAGFAVWSWLLRHLPAGAVGPTTLLNPPLTPGWRAALEVRFPASFALAVAPREWVGGALARAEVAVVVLEGRRPGGGGWGRPGTPGWRRNLLAFRGRRDRILPSLP